MNLQSLSTQLDRIAASLPKDEHGVPPGCVVMTLRDVTLPNALAFYTALPGDERMPGEKVVPLEMTTDVQLEQLHQMALAQRN
jgi:hypothetical protein